MKIPKAIVLLLFSNALFASSDQPYMWNSVFVEAERGVSVRLVRDEESLKIKHFKLTIEGKEIEVSEKWFDDINQPEFRTLKVTWGCGPLALNEKVKIVDAPSCSSHVSFNFQADVDFDIYPDWFEDPKVTYYITDGKITKRYVKRKGSKNHWTLDWLDSSGKKWQGEQISYEK